MRYNPFRYAAPYRDQESPSKYQYYMGARYHDPAYGRFTQADYWEPGFLTPQAFTPLQYAYVMNNPLIFVDPSGHWCGRCLTRAAIGAGVVVAGAVVAGVGVAVFAIGVAELPLAPPVTIYTGIHTMAFGGMIIATGGVIAGIGTGMVGDAYRRR